MNAWSRIQREPLDTTALLQRVSGPAQGALLLFVGVVRDVNDGRAVTGIEYSAYEAMAARELAAIADEAESRFAPARIAVEHRLGELALEEASVAVAVGSPRRAVAYDASRWVVEELKRRVPIWKREQYADGTREWVDPTGAAAAVPVP